MGEYVTGQNITVDGAQSIQNPMFAMVKQMTGGGVSFAGTETDEAEADSDDDAAKSGSEAVNENEGVSNSGAANEYEGTWTAVLETPMGENAIEFVFTDAAGGMKGTVTLAGKQSEIEKVQTTRSGIEFQYRMASPMGEVKVKAKAAIEDGKLKGKLKIPVESIPFEAVRS